MKKIIALTLVLALSLALCSGTVHADSGLCGDRLSWSLNSAGTLTISGSGDMYEYYCDGNNAPWFSHREEITKIVIKNGVTSIGEWAFQSCSNLVSVTIPSSVTSIGWYAFWYCSSLTSINIPSSVSYLGGDAFSGCTSLTSVKIPDGVTSIENETFYNCYALTSVTIPSSITRIGWAFKNCTRLKDVYYGGSKSDREQIMFDNYDNSNDTLINATWHYASTSASSKSSNPYANLSVGSSFEMGYYGNQSLRWRILEKSSSEMLVLCEDGIDSKRYNSTKESVTWATCSLRSWLNDDFYYSAFSSSERDYILTADIESVYCKLYLLSTEEVMQYFSTQSSRICRATTYAVSQGAYVNSDTGGSWWLLRTPGSDNLHVASVNSDGSMDYSGGRVESDRGVVRPAMWISLE